MDKKKLMCKRDVIAKLGISPSKFDKLGLQRVSRYKNNYGGWTYLYNEDDVIKLSENKLIKSLKKGKAKISIDYFSKFNIKYSNHLEALPLICEYLFNINRYPKYSTCSAGNKEEIYNLKNKFIEFLYKNNYCIYVKEHIDKKEYPEIECRYCYGGGCEYCDYTGIYRDEEITELKYYCFYFSINNKIYCWHQPKQHVDYEIKLSTNITENLNSTEVKKIELNKSKFKEAKELIKWFLSKENKIIPLVA